MKLKLEEGKKLAHDALVRLGYSDSAADRITLHLMDSELRGYTSAGFARILAIRDRLGGKQPVEKIEITNETPVMAQLNGHDTFGYLVGERAVELAIEKAKKLGISIVGASNTWTTGMLAYYAEKAAKEDLVTIITANSTPWVAAHGGCTGINGTNPICIGFPSGDVPVILDIATSKILHADVVLSQRLGTELPPESAFNAGGQPTTNPWEVFEGAMAPWGGYKGSGLATMVQLFGVLAGSPAFPPALEQFGFSVIAIDPSNFRTIGEYKKEVDVYREKFKESPPIQGGPPLRLPFERGAKLRQDILDVGEFELYDSVYDLLVEIVGRDRK